MARTKDYMSKPKAKGLASAKNVKKAMQPPTRMERATKAAGKLIEKDPKALDKWIKGLKGKPRG